MPVASASVAVSRLRTAMPGQWMQLGDDNARRVAIDRVSAAIGRAIDGVRPATVEKFGEQRQAPQV